MNHLNYQDWQTLVSAIGDLHSDFDPRTLQARTLTAASKIVRADSAAFTGFCAGGQYADLMWNDGGDFSAQEMEVFAAHIHENPLFEEFIIKKRTEALKITDLLPTSEFQRTTIYNDFYRRVGVSNQLVKPMQITDDLLITCSINIENSDFTERDKMMLDLIAPHLAAAIRSSFAYQRLSAALDTEACGIVALNSAGKPVFISEYARLLFEKYFAGEKCAADNLPEKLNDWIVETKFSRQPNEFAAPSAPFEISNQNGVLTVRLTSGTHTREQTLTLEEKRFASPHSFAHLSVTKREAEILNWLSKGKSDEVIAQICGISTRTVHKHVQNIYIKLGVETRTAALLKALEIGE